MSALYIGLMSGTSIDALDAALVDLSDAHRPRLLAAESYAWSTSEREELLALSAGTTHEIDRSGEAGVWWSIRASELIATLLHAQGLTPEAIVAVGSHGQTLRHRPSNRHPFSLQIGDPSVLAERCGISVVTHFRQRDLAAGGQGAPLVPAFHQALFGQNKQCVVALNLGGIANISVMHSGQPVRGYDTGPANMLLDAWCLRHTGNAYDDNGQWAQRGQCHDDLLKRLMSAAYFAMPAPKSTGRESFGKAWLLAALEDMPTQIKPEDVQATLLALTATTVADAIKREANTGKLIICGGGANNSALVAALAAQLPAWQCQTSADMGYPTQSIEAMAFAWLAMRFMQGQSGNAPSATGAHGERILGGLFPA